MNLCGIISGLFRYPVKSMRGESLSQGHLYWHGLDGDRRYAFVRQGVNGGFPWLTGRELPDLLRYTPRLLEPETPGQSSVVVVMPDGREFPVESPERPKRWQRAITRLSFCLIWVAAHLIARCCR